MFNLTNRIALKNITIAFYVVLALASCTKEKKASESAKIDIGTIDSLDSKILNEQRKVWIYVPSSAKNSKTRYPVIYLLDGDGHFYDLVAMTHQLSSVNGNTRCPEMIVVGIPNTDRTRDLTPTAVKKVFGDTTFSRTSGGGENFMKFIREELIPYVDEHYPTSANRTLIGHSLGGLMTIHALVNHTDLFANYIAIDPSLWWDDQKLMKDGMQALQEKKFENKSLYVAIANTLNDDMSLDIGRKDTSSETLHLRSIFLFSEAAKAKSGNGLNFNYKYYGDDDHGSVPLIAEYDGLRFLFSWYTMRGLDKFFKPNSTASADEVLSFVNGHYKNVSDRFGYTVIPPENFVNGLGYAFLGNRKQDRAYALFNLNIQNFPESSNVYDSMGDYYLAQKDTTQAIQFFNKALEKADVPATKDKLKKLKAKV
jgi:predicted alpha/beta superfamily hydrolase